MPRLSQTHQRRPGSIVEGVVVRSARDPRAPNLPEWREATAVAPLPSVEEMARQLADDPEFREWAAAERRAMFAAGRPG